MRVRVSGPVSVLLAVSLLIGAQAASASAAPDVNRGTISAKASFTTVSHFLACRSGSWDPGCMKRWVRANGTVLLTNPTRGKVQFDCTVSYSQLVNDVPYGQSFVPIGDTSLTATLSGRRSTSVSWFVLGGDETGSDELVLDCTWQTLPRR